MGWLVVMPWRLGSVAEAGIVVVKVQSVNEPGGAAVAITYGGPGGVAVGLVWNSVSVLVVRSNGGGPPLHVIVTVTVPHRSPTMGGTGLPRGPACTAPV